MLRTLFFMCCMIRLFAVSGFLMLPGSVRIAVRLVGILCLLGLSFTSKRRNQSSGFWPQRIADEFQAVAVGTQGSYLGHQNVLDGTGSQHLRENI